MAMMAYDERRILEMLHEDDISRRRAFEAIVNNFSEQLYWQIRHMVLFHDDANDILQNTFIKAWTNLDSFMGYSRISTWLYRIAVNETLTSLTGRKRPYLWRPMRRVNSVLQTAWRVIPILMAT